MAERSEAPTHADREGFAVLAARVAVSRHIATSAEPRLSDFALDAVVDGVSRRVYLHDALTEALGAAANARTGVITTWMRAYLGEPCGESWETVEALVRPVVRNVWFGTDALVRRPAGFDPHFAELVAFPLGDGLRYVTTSDLEAWGLDAEAVFSRARASLLSNEVEVERSAGDAQLRLSIPGVESSALILVPDRVAPILVGEGAHSALAIPDRHSLIALRAQAGTMPQLAAIAAAGAESAAQPLSGLAYVVSERGIDTMSLPDDSEHAPAIVAAERQRLLETYQAQTRVLRQRHPDYEVPEPEPRIGELVCSWNEGTHALLPEVASVKLVTKRGARTVTVQWWGMPSLVGSTFAQEPDLFPPRWSAFAWKKDDVRAFDEDEDEDVDPELEARLDEDEAQWEDLGSGDEEDENDDDDNSVWHEGDPDAVCPFCGSGLRGGVVCEVCGRAPAEAKTAVVATTHAIRLLQALVDGSHLELTSQRAVPAVGRAIAEVLDGTSDWAAQAAALSTRLLSMDAVAEVFVDDAALAELLARTAVAPDSDAVTARVAALDAAEAASLSAVASLLQAKKIVNELYTEDALDYERVPLEDVLPRLGEAIVRAAPGGPPAIAAAVFEVLSGLPDGVFSAESPDEIEAIVARCVVAPAAPGVPDADTAPASAKDPVTLPAAKRLMRRLLDEGHAELVAGGSLELLEYAIAELLASEDANDAGVLHALLDEMDEDVVLFADAPTLAKLPKR